MAMAVRKGRNDGGDDGKRDKGMEHEREAHGKEYAFKRKATYLLALGSEDAYYT
jgi:hypothetical protein